jgi:hypothetical protein
MHFRWHSRLPLPKITQCCAFFSLPHGISDICFGIGRALRSSDLKEGRKESTEPPYIDQRLYCNHRFSKIGKRARAPVAPARLASNADDANEAGTDRTGLRKARTNERRAILAQNAAMPAQGMLSDDHDRDHVSEAELALDRDGRFLALRARNISNIGAYLAPGGIISPTMHLGGLAGTYTTPAIYVEVSAVFTNTTSIGPYRGSGRPEASYIVEPPDGHLTAKSVPFGLARPQHLPEPFLGFGHLATERPGALVGTLSWLLLHRRSRPPTTSPPTPSLPF